MNYATSHDLDQSAVRHEIIFTDHDDETSYTSQGRYGRQKLSSREYVYNGVNYGNKYAEWVKVMNADGYDMKNPGNITITIEKHSDAAIKIADKIIKILEGESPKDELRNLEEEGDAFFRESKRLSKLKSKRSQDKSKVLFDNGLEVIAKINEIKMSDVELKRQQDLFEVEAISMNLHYYSAINYQSVGVEYTPVTYIDNREACVLKNNYIFNTCKGI